MIMAKGFWKRRLLVVILIVAGSILILFPAWLPDSGFPSTDERTAEGGQLEETTSKGFSLPTEESAVEGLQLLLLLGSAAFWYGAAKSAGEIGPFYRVMGAGGIAAALGEADYLVNDNLNIPSWILFVIPALYILFLSLKYRRQFPAFYTEFTSHPAAGFFASAFMMIYVLARLLGTPHLWKATLKSNYHPDVPSTVQGYLELLACYLLFVGTIGLCLRDRRHDVTED